MVGLADRAQHYPRQLSGGQEQRVGIARAIVTDPTLLLCDEPTGDLDRKAGDEILDLLQALNREHGKTIVMVTHDPHAAERAKRTLHLDKGLLTKAEDAHEVPAARLEEPLAAQDPHDRSRSLSIFVAFLLFGLLMTIRTAFTFGVERRRRRPAGADPQGQPDHAAAGVVPGAARGPCPACESATHNTWFGGILSGPGELLRAASRSSRRRS